MKNKTLALLLGIAAIIASVGILIWAISASKQTTISKVDELTNVDNSMPTGSIYHGKCGKNLIWTLDTSTGSLIIAGNGAMYDYDYSSSEPWYTHRDSIKRVAFSEGVTTIGYNAFHECEKIASVSIPNSVKKINGWAFMGCDSLKSISIPSSVTYIGDRVFAYTKLKSITLPERVTAIEEGLFNTCSSLTSISIPNSVKSIGDNTFQYCKALENITIPYGITRIGVGAFSDCNGLTSIVIPNSVTYIGNSAFFFCENLTSVIIPNSVTHIGVNLFRGCHNLTVYTASSVDLSETSIPADRIVKITQEEAMERYLKENPDQEEYMRQYEKEKQMKAQQKQLQQQQQKKANSKGHLLYNGFEIKGKRSECYDKVLRGVISYPLKEDNDHKMSIFRTAPPFDEAENTLCLIYVEGTPKTDQVYCVDETINFSLIEDINTWADIKKVYLKRKESLIKIYGKPKLEKEYFESPYSETNNPIKAIDEGKIHYRTEIYTDNGRIVHTITNHGTDLFPWQVFTVYIDAEGERLYKQER